jgi:membrane-bound serine protease (ClpP class)
MILLLAVILILLLSVGGTTAVAILVVACILEAGELLFLRRWSRRIEHEQPAVSPDEELIGLLGEVVTPCRPTGQVRVRGELWSATCPSGAESGATVRVEGVDGLTIHVAPAA